MSTLARWRSARVLRDDSQDETEPIYVYADPSGHPFIFVAPARRLRIAGGAVAGGRLLRDGR